MLAAAGGSVETRWKQLLHRFAGEAARSKCGKAWEALRTRCLACRRWQQRVPWGMRHPCRFKLRRWEEQLACYYGDVPEKEPCDDAG